MASRSVNHPVSSIGQRTGRSAMSGSARKMGSRKDVFDSQTSKEGVSMEKKKGQQQGKATTSWIKKNSALTDASNSIRQSPRKKQCIPFNKPIKSGSANPSTSRKVERRTGAAAFAGKHIRLKPDGAENVADYQTDDESTATEPSARESVTKEKNITFNESPGNVPKRRQSPRKKQVTDVKLVNTDPVRYASPKVGRRTGEAAFAGKRIRIMPDGFENFEDYWTDDESTATEPLTDESVTKANTVSFNESPRNVPERRQSPRKKQVTDVKTVNIDPVRYASPKVGRRTGETAFAGKRIRINPDGFENFEDYWTENESTATESSTRKSVTIAKTVAFNESSENVPKRRQSPRKKQVTNVKSVNTDPVRYASPKIGRRTGEAAFAGKRIRIMPDGFENFEDYWTDDGSTATESSTHESVTNGKTVSFNESPGNVPERRRSPRKKQVADVEESVKSDPLAYALPRVGRRAGEAAFAGKHIRLKPDGTENFEDYWTDEALNLNESSITKSSVTLSESSSNNDDEPEKVMLDKACNTFRNVGVNDTSLISIRNKKDSFKHRHSVQRTLFPNELSLSKSPKKRDKSIGKNSLKENIFKENDKVTESPRKNLKKQKCSTSTSSRNRSQLFEDLKVTDESANIGKGTVALIRSGNETVTDKSCHMSRSKNSRSSRSKLIEEVSGDSDNEFDNIIVDKIPSTRDERGASTHSPSRKTNKLNTSHRKSQVVENDAEESAQESELGANELASEENAPISIESKKKRKSSARNKSRLIDDDSEVSGNEFDNIGVNEIPSTRDEGGASSHSPSSKTKKLNTSKLKRKSQVVENDAEKSAQENELGANELASEENTPMGKESKKKKQSSARKKSRSIDDDSEVSGKEFDDIPSIRDEGGASTHSPSRKTNRLTTSKRKSQVAENDAEESAQESGYGANELASEENAPISIESKKKRKSSARNKSRLIDDDSEVSGNEFDNIGVYEIPSTRDEGGASSHSPTKKWNTSKSKSKSQVVENDAEISAQENEFGAKELASKENAPMDKESKTKKQRSAKNKSRSINDDFEVSGKEFDDIPSTRDVGGASTHSPSSNTKKLNTSKSKRKSQVVEYDTEESVRENELFANELSSEENTPMDKESKTKKQRSARNKSRSINDDSEVSGKELDDIRVKEILSTRDKVDGDSKHSPSRKAALTDKLKTSKSKRKSQVAESETEDSGQENELDANELAYKENAPSGKKSKKRHNEIPADQLRRSNREHTRLLAFWRGERRTVRIAKGEFVIDGIDPGWWEDNSSKNAVASSVQKRHNYTVKEQEKTTLKRLPKTTVLIPQTHEHVEVNLHRPFNFIEWSAVNGAKDQKVPYYLTKTFSSERVTFGFLDICPLEQKASQYSPEDNIHFTVQKGRVKVIIRKTDFEFEKNDSFIVPCTEAYSIQNLGKSNALLSFCTFKIPFFSYQSV